MYIESITLEGFKSYGTRTEISRFDPSFNAITGLNGSGKSNILDSICFVLGISNLSQVRANNLNELVYKNGQAGINRATVTIVFNNEDPNMKPIGLVNDKKIIVTRSFITGGKNKYFINGVAANNSKIHDLFQSVHLNINNPHFLIMQGRITKVLNMKPLEILCMIEEAAGTRMYEVKKGISMKGLEKKESVVREINTILAEHVFPQLEKLREDAKEFAEYSKVLRKHEKLSKLSIAWDYTKTEEIIKKSTQEKIKLNQLFEKHKTEIKDIQKQLKEADQRIKEIEKQMDVDGCNKLQELEEELKKTQVTEIKTDTQFKNLQGVLNEEKKKKIELIKNLNEEKATLTQKEKEVENSLPKLEDLRKLSDQDSVAEEKAENHFHAVNAGLSDESGEEARLAVELTDARKAQKDEETKEKSLEMIFKHMKSELGNMEREIQKVNQRCTQDVAAYEASAKEAKELKAEIFRLGYEEGKYEALLCKKRKLVTTIDKLRDDHDLIFARYPLLSLNYVNPTKNFNRQKVTGPVCLQMEIKDPKFSVALEIIAGRKLYDIIVDDEETGKLLLGKGQLKRRITIIPLNKITSKPIENKTVQEAESLVGPNNVVTALSCINFADYLKPAMEYVFGGTFICPNMEFAKEVAFANNIRRRCVTLEGEVFNPSGTLSGGSLGDRGKLLAELAHFCGLKKEIRTKEQELNKLENEIYHANELNERYDALCDELKLKENEASLMKIKIEQSSYHQKQEEFQKLHQSLEEQKSLFSACKERQEKAAKRIKELELKTSQSTGTIQIKEAGKAVTKCKKKAAVSLEKYNAFQAVVNGLKLEIGGIIDGLPASEKAIEHSSKSIEELEKKLEKIDVERKKIKESVSSHTEKCKVQKAVLKSHGNEIVKLSKEKTTMLKKISDAELQIQQLEHDVKNYSENEVEAKKKMKHLLEKYKWIKEGKKFFGVTNSEYDFEFFNPKTAASKLKELEECKEKLHKNVNLRAQNLLSSVEKQYKNVIEKMDIIRREKAVISTLIEMLDKSAKGVIRHACEQVNKDFGSIFQTLLPGTKAKLVPQIGKTVLDGLEFKVAFGNVWKESLNELSGGQRSLVALSLILALLLFKPAPIYILDEIDAALDLSHTENIGKMLKLHFTNSQFIIVSLKNGMFENANVLFNTYFSDGMSTVTRVSQRP